MNITDSKDLEKVKEPWVSFLLARQAELVIKYKDIEKMPKLPMNIELAVSQSWVKDFFWRVTEELMEAQEAMNKDEREHYLEELSDALHFYLEVYILLDIRPLNFSDKILENLIKRQNSSGLVNDSSAIEGMYRCIYNMGLAGNCLRNKKWKQSQVFVDKNKFMGYLNEGFIYLIGCIISSGVNSKFDLLNLYYKKYQVNQFRIRSDY